MKVHIRTEEKCPCCKKCFQKNNYGDLFCFEHQTRPKHYYLDWCYKGEQFKAWGIDSYNQAVKDAAQITWEIDNHCFDPEKYRGRKKAASKYAFTHVYDEWLKGREQEVDLAPSYLEKLKQYRKDFVAFFKDEDVREIRTFNIKKFRQSFPKELKGRTVRNKLAVLQKFFNDLADDEFITKDVPKFNLKAITVQDEFITNTLDKETQLKILNEMPAADRPFFQFRMASGLRPSEVRALKWKNVFRKAPEPYILICAGFSKGIYRQVTKTKNQWVIAITKQIEEILDKVPRRLDVDYVFWYQYKKNCVRPYGEKKYRAVWKAACEKAGVVFVNTYVGTRHSFGRQQVEKGTPLDLIQAQMGHRSVQTTKRYAQYDKIKAMREAFEN